MVFNLFSDKETACYLIAWQYACPVYVNCHKRTIYVALLWQQYLTYSSLFPSSFCRYSFTVMSNSFLKHFEKYFGLL
jgi:hypothetical protein